MCMLNLPENMLGGANFLHKNTTNGFNYSFGENFDIEIFYYYLDLLVVDGGAAFSTRRESRFCICSIARMLIVLN